MFTAPCTLALSVNVPLTVPFYGSCAVDEVCYVEVAALNLFTYLTLDLTSNQKRKNNVFD